MPSLFYCSASNLYSVSLVKKDFDGLVKFYSSVTSFMIYHDNNGLCFDFFGTCGITEAVCRLGDVRLGWRNASYLKMAKDKLT